MKKFCLFLGLFFLLTSQATAQNKVVVIPLDSGDCNCDQIPTVTSAGQVWMDRNLGAVRVALSSDDYHAYGWRYQWGRLADGHEIHSNKTSDTSDSDVPGHGNFITPSSAPQDWRTPPNPNLWQGEAGINNPCPADFRVPTQTEWEIEIDSWSSKNPAGAFASPLKLVVAGGREHRSDGTVFDVGHDGYYWSSTVDESYARNLNFGSGTVGNNPRAYGFSVRCIKD